MSETQDWGLGLPVLETRLSGGRVRWDVIAFDAAGGVAWSESVIAADAGQRCRDTARTAFERWLTA